MDNRKKVARELMTFHKTLTYTKALRQARSVIPASRNGTSSPAQLEMRATIALALLGHPLAYRASSKFSVPSQTHRLFTYTLVTISGDAEEYRFDCPWAPDNVTHTLSSFPAIRYARSRESDGRAELVHVPSGATITGPHVDYFGKRTGPVGRDLTEALSPHERLLVSRVQKIPNSARMLLASVTENMLSPLVMYLDRRGKHYSLPLPHVWSWSLEGAGSEWVLRMRGEPAAMDALIAAMTTRPSRLPGCRLRSIDTSETTRRVEMIAELDYEDATLTIILDATPGGD